MKKDIYVIRNTVNDKVYVGQTKNLDQRWGQHLSAAKTGIPSLIYEEMRNLGADKFFPEVLESGVENYDEREEYWVEKLNSKVPNGYNVATGGKGTGRGINSVVGSIKSEDILLDIIFKIRYSQMSFNKIAALYGCSANTVSDINRGAAYNMEGFTYPLRPSKYTFERVKQLMYSLKYEKDKSMTDIAKEYDMDLSQVGEINQGKIYTVDSESYPLRKGKVKNPAYKHLDEIIHLLKDTDIPQKDIAEKFSVSVNVISGINKGRSYHRDDFTYPLRQNYQCKNGARVCFSPNEVREIEKALADREKSIRDIANEYSVSPNTIMNMNNGSILKYRNKDVKYPIRTKQPVSTRNV